VLTPLKRFLLIFLMLAMPVQVFASVSQLGTELTRSESKAHSSHDKAMTACHEASTDQPCHQGMEQHGSHCAACYLAAFPIPTDRAVLVEAIPYTPHLHPAVLFSGFIPEGPERPPRSSLT
jgi:hypothetical protein